MRNIVLLALTSSFLFAACTTGGNYSKNDCGCKPKKEKVCGCETCDK